jgi:hypothetical protein
MAKGYNSRLPTELPREVLSRLDPRLRELYSQLPSALASRISDLMGQALPERIHPDRVFKFAFLYATAEVVAQRNAASKAVSKEHTRRSKLELAGGIHGLQTGYRDDVEAKQLYRRGRRVRQQIKASLEALQVRWRAFKQVVQKNREALPLHVQSRFSDEALREVGRALQNMGIAVAVDEDDLTSEKGREPECSERTQAYIWWCLNLAPYRGKWNDMHRLARAWHLSSATSVKDFRTVVSRICKGAPCADRFGTSWESVLSQKL